MYFRGGIFIVDKKNVLCYNKHIGAKIRLISVKTTIF